MGHMTVLVIGNDPKDQLDKFQRADYADSKNRHFVVVDTLEREKRDYIPGGFLDWFEETDNRWKLKHEAVGYVIRSSDWIEELATDGYAGSARKDAIDLDGMRNPMHKAAADWWDCAAGARGSKTWEPFRPLEPMRL